MLSNRKLFLLVIAVWCVLLMRNNPWGSDAHQQTSRQVSLLFPNLAQQLPQMQRVEISDKDSRVNLQLAGSDSIYSAEQWIVESKNHPVDRARLMYLLDGISQLRGIDLVSIRKSSHELYGVNDGDGTRVQAYDSDGNKIVDWIAGAIRSQDIAGIEHPVFEYYMRRADSNEVFLSGSAIQPSATPFDWCDVNFLRGIDAEHVKRIGRLDFQRKLSWTIERVQPPPAASQTDAARWLLSEPLDATIDNFSGDSLAFSCVNLQASGVVGLATTAAIDDQSYGFPQDRFIVGIGENELQFELGSPARDGHRYLRVSGLQHIYTISDFEVGQLRQDIRSLQDSTQ